MQPFTPLRQQHLVHNTNSRPRRSSATSRGAEGSSRRSARLVAAAASNGSAINAGKSTLLDDNSRASPRRHSNSTREAAALAPPLNLSITRARKRRREEEILLEGQQTHDSITLNESSLPGQTASTTNISTTTTTTTASRDLADLFANGRALYNATTTSLAAPVEIPNKKPRLSNTPLSAAAAATGHASTANAANAAEAPSSRTRLRTRSGNIALATPLHTAKRSLTAANSVNAGSANKCNSNRSSRTKRMKTTQEAQITSQKRALAILGKPAEVVSVTRRTRAQKDEDRRLQQEHEAAEWKKKYKRAFKSFVFYFDGFDASRRKEAEKYVRDLGAKVESFFSKQVSHVVTTRPIPEKLLAPSSLNVPTNSATLSITQATRANIFQAPGTAITGKENIQPLAHLLQPRNSSESPVKQGGKDAFAGHSKRAKNRLGASNANTMMFPMRTPPKIKPYADFERTESNDILTKAQSFGMKLWNVEKLVRVLERLISNDSPSQAILRQQTVVNQTATAAAGYAYSLQMNNSLAKSTLPSLLRAEALAGSTYERDLSTLRPDHHYFDHKKGYILVEDSSGDFAPAHVKEYEQRIVAKPSEGRDRETDWPTLWGGQEGRQAFCKPSASHKPPLPSMALIKANQRGPIVTLERTMSLDAYSAKNGKRKGLPDSQLADPGSYLAASGNSQIITSNIQSGTSTRSGQNAVAGNVIKAGGNSLANGLIINKHLARLGSKNAHVVTLGKNSIASTSNATYAAEISQRASGHMKRTVSLDTGLKDLRTLKPPKPEPKKPGYCENCRVRFDDFKAHTVTKKHRRFALDETNWTLVDALFSRIKRPINPDLQELYDDAECEVPSDVEATDKEDDVDMSDDGEDEVNDSSDGEMDDSGYHSDTMQAFYASIERACAEHALECPCGNIKENCDYDSERATSSQCDDEEEESDSEEDTPDWALRGATNGPAAKEARLPEDATDEEVETSEEEDAMRSPQDAEVEDMRFAFHF